METKIIDGKKLREEILEEIRKDIRFLPFQPIFSDVLVGEDPASMQYVDMKARTAESVGIKFHRANFPASINTEELVGEIQKLNKIENMCGVIIQLPLPPHIDRQTVLNAIDPALDVDCLGQVRSEKFYAGDAEIGYPTAMACMKLIDSLELELKGKNIAVIGQGMLVGKPVAALLRFRGLEPSIVTRATENKEELIRNADVIISGTGAGKLIKGEGIKEGSVLIDAGTSESNGAIVGDVDLDSVRGIARYVSPVPGGVGPVTVAMLLKNVLAVAKKK